MSAEIEPPEGGASALATNSANVIGFLHSLIVGYLVVAWTLPWKSALWFAFFFYPLVALNWCALQNRCILTIIEERLRGEDWAEQNRAKTAAAGDDAEPNFISRLLSGILGRPVPVHCADRISYSVVYGGFAATTYRLFA